MEPRIFKVEGLASIKADREFYIMEGAGASEKNW